MSKIRSGGPAFPHEDPQQFWSGMSLRDYIAAKVVAVLMTDENYGPKSAAADAYKVADAMIEEREKP